MIAILARMKVGKDKTADFESTMIELSQKVRTEEKGCKAYQVCKTSEEGSYVVMELYEDQTAVDTHMKTSYFQAASSRLASLLASRPEIEFLNTLE